MPIKKTPAETKPEFPPEIFIYSERENRRYSGARMVLRVAEDAAKLGTARGRNVGVYRLAKTVKAVKKTTISVSVSETK